MSRTITVYRIDPQTRECAGTDVAEESPLEPGKFLVPAHATEIAPPPVPPGHIARFVSGAWELEPRRSSRAVIVARAHARVRLARHLDVIVEAAYAREAQLEAYLDRLSNDVAVLDSFDPAALWG